MVERRMEDLSAAIIDGDCAKSVSLTERLLESGIQPEVIVVDGLEAAMSALDSRCTLEQFNLLEIMLAGRAVTEIMKILYPPGTAMTRAKGVIIVATLEGDVHDLGKNILRMVLAGNGYCVIDCGRDCPLGKLIEEAEKEHPLAVGVSGLITPVIPQVRRVKDMLNEKGLPDIKVIAGGAALKQLTPQRLNVDFVAESAFDCLHYLQSTRGGRI